MDVFVDIHLQTVEYIEVSTLVEPVASVRFPGDWYLLKKPQLTLRTAPFRPRASIQILQYTPHL